jgi:hypothetical protein
VDRQHWEFWIAVGVFAVLFVLVTAWAGRRVPGSGRRAHWLMSTAIFVVVVAGLWTWDAVS